MGYINSLLSFSFILFAFFLNILGLMNMIPLLITMPFLFFSIFISLFLVNSRYTFKGF
nr:hypothetical protein [Metabacillus lacus]